MNPDTIGCRTPGCDRLAILYAAGPTAGTSPRLTLVAGPQAARMAAPDAVTTGSAVCLDCACSAVEALTAGPDDAGECCCAGCIGMGPCDDGVPCPGGCGGTVTGPPGQQCGPCERDVLGLDDPSTDEDED